MKPSLRSIWIVTVVFATALGGAAVSAASDTLFFDSSENYRKLVWLGTAEGQNFTKRFGAAIQGAK